MTKLRLIDCYASASNYLEHVLPVWLTFDPEERGMAYIPPRLHDRALAAGVSAEELSGSVPGPAPRAMLVASWSDERKCGGRPIVYMEHGAGQSYFRDRLSARNESFPGGRGHERVVLFLTPGPMAAARWREWYPEAPVIEVGCPKLDTWHTRDLTVTAAVPTVALSRTVAISFHGDVRLIPETRNAWAWYHTELGALSERFDLLGHAHRRFWGIAERRYRQLGIRATPDFADVLDQAAVYIVDNSSTAVEFMSLDRPVVLMNAPWYRRDIEHGGRFWEWAEAANTVDTRAQLAAAITDALEHPERYAAQRQRILAGVYAACDGAAAARAADAIRAHVAPARGGGTRMSNPYAAKRALHAPQSPAYEQAPQGTVSEIMEWVGQDRARAAAALVVEQKERSPRKTLVSSLQQVLDG